jgi:hypothetical protein
MVAPHHNTLRNLFEGEHIRQGNLQKYRGNFVIPVTAPAMDGKTKVYFCWRFTN